MRAAMAVIFSFFKSDQRRCENEQEIWILLSNMNHHLQEPAPSKARLAPQGVLKMGSTFSRLVLKTVSRDCFEKA
jgi:hypothetical protein